MMEKAGSAVNILGNKYASTESNILQFLSEAGGLAKVWKMDVAETAAIGSVLETVNIKASEGETMFRSALNAGIFQKRALQPDQLKAFKQAGVRVKGGGMGYDVAGSILGISGKDFQGRLNENMADTMFSVVDAILEKSGGNDSLAQQMAEAVFGSYGMAFLKLGGQRGNLAEMTEEARKGFDAGTSMEEEYQRQTANLIDTFGQTKEIFSAMAKVIGGYLLPPLALLLGVFNAILAPIAKFAIFMQNLVFKQIDELIGKFKGSNLGKDLGAAMKSVMDSSSKIWEVIGPIVVKLLEGLIDLLTIQFSLILWAMTAAYDFLRPIFVVIADAVLALVDKLKGMWNWLMDAIPGARKEEARLRLEAAAKKEGLGVTASGFISTLDSRGNITGSAPTTIPDNLIDLQAKYQALPGFAEGIADAVKAGISSIGDTIANKIADALPDWEFPSFDELTAALENLPQKIKDAILGNEFTYMMAKYGGETYIQGTDPEGNKTYWKQRDFLGIDSLRSDEVITEDDLPEAVRDQWGIGHAAGLTFTGTGTYFGKFHGPEEVLSQASTIRGPGIIARAMEALDGAARGSGQAGLRGETHIHVENKNRFDFAGARFSPDFDMEAFLRMIDTRIETGSVEAAKRVIGNRRT
jgi:TP901 family phage tail tape measure protein